MIKRISSLVLCTCMVFSSCENMYRDEIAELHKEIDEVKARLDAVCEQMGRTPPWAEGLLLRADGYETKFYRKD